MKEELNMSAVVFRMIEFGNNRRVTNVSEKLEAMNQMEIESCKGLVYQIIKEKLRIHYSNFKYTINESNWLVNIQDLQHRLRKKLTSSIHNYLKLELQIIYSEAVKDMTKQLKFLCGFYPFKCPYTLKQIIWQIKM